MQYIIIVSLILIFIYIIAIMPKIINRKDLKDFSGKYFAHRGLHNNKDIPENSYSAFDLAVKHNYGIELDIHLTKDNVPVVFHDFTLERMCGVNFHIKDLTFDDLSKYTLKDSNEPIPTLENVLSLVDGKVPLIIEYKTGKMDTNICEHVQEMLDYYCGPYCIESFNPLVLFWYKSNRPSIIRGQLSAKYLYNKENDNNHGFILNFLLQNLSFNFFTRPDFIAFDHETPNLLGFQISRRLYKTPSFAWTIRSNNKLKKAYNNFDAYIFEGFLPNN